MSISRRGFLKIAGLGALACAMSGCVTPSWISDSEKEKIISQVGYKKYVAIFDGLSASGWAIDIQKSLRGDYVGFATAGNQGVHMPIIEEFYNRGKEPSIIGFSLGGDPAIALAEECKARGIIVKKLILLDPYSGRQIPSNVLKVVEGRSTEPYAFQMKKIDASRLENPSMTSLETFVVQGNHFHLPSGSLDIINRVLNE